MKADKNTTIDGSLLAAGKNGYGSYGGGGAGGSVWIQTGEFFGAGTIDVKGESNGGTAGQYEIIRIHHECEGGIEKSVPRITIWHHEACRVMTNGDPEGRIFITHPHTNNGFFFLLTIKYCILYWKKHENDFQKILNRLRYNMVT